jgi:hypothetical protein
VQGKLNIGLFGNPCVGKTSLLSSLIGGRFRPDEPATLTCGYVCQRFHYRLSSSVAPPAQQPMVGLLNSDGPEAFEWAQKKGSHLRGSSSGRFAD